LAVVSTPLPFASVYSTLTPLSIQLAGSIVGALRLGRALSPLLEGLVVKVWGRISVKLRSLH
jgi:hypothetical protein